MTSPEESTRYLELLQQGQERTAELQRLRQEVRQLRGLTRRGWWQTASVIRDIAGRIGVAASPQTVRDRLEKLASQLEAWATLDKESSDAPSQPAT